MDSLPFGEESTVGFKANLPDSKELWDRGWPQSPEEFEMLVEVYIDRLVLSAYRRLGNFHDAEDVVQEVFVRAYTERSKRKKISLAGPYLYRMVINACTDLLRKRKRLGMTIKNISVEEIPSGLKNPYDETAAAEKLHRVEKLLRRLPKVQAEVIRLRVFDELRLSEIAEVVGCSIDTVRSRLRYGFGKLRKIVSREHRE